MSTLPLNKVIEKLNERLEDRLEKYKYATKEDSIVHQVADSKDEKEITERVIKMRTDKETGKTDLEDDGTSKEPLSFQALYTELLNLGIKNVSEVDGKVLPLKNLIATLTKKYGVNFQIPRDSFNEVEFELDQEGNVIYQQISQIIAKGSVPKKPEVQPRTQAPVTTKPPAELAQRETFKSGATKYAEQ